jgi:hypothetical protein
MAVRSRPRRVLALVTGLWLVVFGVLGTRHEAQIAHYVDQSGHAHHAARLAGAHTATQSDMHAVDGDPDAGACAIETTLHQAASPHVAPPAVVYAPRAELVAEPAAHAIVHAGALLYRLAPKTSPPLAA